MGNAANNERNTLFQWVWRNHVRAALIPLALLELIFAGVYLGVSALAHDMNVQSAREEAERQLLDLAAGAAQRVDAQLRSVAQLTEVLRARAQEVLAAPEAPSAPPPGRYAFSDTGVYYKTHDDGGLAVFYSAVNGRVGPREQAKAWRLERLAPTIRQLHEVNPLVQQVYLNTHDSLSLIYPFFDVVRQYSPRLNIPDYAFYYLADAEHNPERKVVWTDVYIDPAGQGWMTSSIAPVYHDDILEGVVGLDLTVKTIIGQIDGLALPWRSYGMLVNKQGTIMALPPQGEGDWGLQELTDHAYADYITSDHFKPEAFNLLLRDELGDFPQAFRLQASGLARLTLNETSLVAWDTVTETGWKVMVVTPEREVFAAAEALRARLQQVFVWLLVGLLLFYLVFLFFIYQRVRTVSQGMAQPLTHLQELLHRISLRQYQQPEPVFPVQELQQTAGQVMRMGRQLESAHAALHDAKQALERHSGFVATLLDAIPTPVCYQEGLRQRLVGNQAFETFFGVTASQLAGRNLSEFIPAVTLPLQQERVSYEIQLSDATGQAHQMVVHLTRLQGGREEQPGCIGILFDVSESEHVRQQLEFARDRALEASQLKSEFIAAVSHEVRAPLNGIIGLGELLRESPLNDEQRHFVETQLESAGALLDILNGLLEVAQHDADGDALQLSRFEPRKLAQRVVELMQAQARQKGLTLRMELDRALPEQLKGDERRLQQILLNLLGNAIKFTPQGTVTLHIRVEHWEARRVVLRFAVQDTGIGIASADHERIFQPFTQLDAGHARHFGGTGLGLSICRQLVQRMGGEIGFSSQPKVGSTFYFTVPLALAVAETVKPATAGRVLVVDDGPVNSMLAKTVLSKAGYQVAVAANGAQALELAGQQAFDLVLMDIYMPGMDGMEVTRRWRERERATGAAPAVIVALTANAIEQDRQQFFAAGMDDYLGKPYRPAELRELADKWLTRRQSLSSEL